MADTITRGPVYFNGQQVYTSSASWSDGQYQSTGLVYTPGGAIPPSGSGYYVESIDSQTGARTYTAPSGEQYIFTSGGERVTLEQYRVQLSQEEAEKRAREAAEEAARQAAEQARREKVQRDFEASAEAQQRRREELVQEEWSALAAQRMGGIPSEPTDAWKETPLYQQAERRAKERLAEERKPMVTLEPMFKGYQTEEQVTVARIEKEGKQELFKVSPRGEVTPLIPSQEVVQQTATPSYPVLESTTSLWAVGTAMRAPQMEVVQPTSLWRVGTTPREKQLIVPSAVSRGGAVIYTFPQAVIQSETRNVWVTSLTQMYEEHGIPYKVEGLTTEEIVARPEKLGQAFVYGGTNLLMSGAFIVGEAAFRGTPFFIASQIPVEEWKQAPLETTIKFGVSSAFAPVKALVERPEAALIIAPFALPALGGAGLAAGGLLLAGSSGLWLSKEFEAASKAGVSWEQAGRFAPIGEVSAAAGVAVLGGLLYKVATPSWIEGKADIKFERYKVGESKGILETEIYGTVEKTFYKARPFAPPEVMTETRAFGLTTQVKSTSMLLPDERNYFYSQDIFLERGYGYAFNPKTGTFYNVRSAAFISPETQFKGWVKPEGVIFPTKGQEAYGFSSSLSEAGPSEWGSSFTRMRDYASYYEPGYSLTGQRIVGSGFTGQGEKFFSTGTLYAEKPFIKPHEFAEVRFTSPQFTLYERGVLYPELVSQVSFERTGAFISQRQFTKTSNGLITPSLMQEPSIQGTTITVGRGTQQLGATMQRPIPMPRGMLGEEAILSTISVERAPSFLLPTSITYAVIPSIVATQRLTEVSLPRVAQTSLPSIMPISLNSTTPVSLTLTRSSPAVIVRTPDLVIPRTEIITIPRTGIETIPRTTITTKLTTSTITLTPTYVPPPPPSVTPYTPFIFVSPPPPKPGFGVGGVLGGGSTVQQSYAWGFKQPKAFKPSLIAKETGFVTTARQAKLISEQTGGLVRPTISWSSKTKKRRR